MDGVIPYSVLPMQPVYEGLNLYDIGGAGNNGLASVGEGLGQTFATTTGATYQLSFGLSAENVPGSSIETLRVSAGTGSMDYVLTPNGDPVFSRAFTTEGFSFVATSASTTLSFILQASSGPAGNNDPLFDGVVVNLVSAPVPEPHSWALMLAGTMGLAFALRRRHG